MYLGAAGGAVLEFTLAAVGTLCRGCGSLGSAPRDVSGAIVEMFLPPCALREKDITHSLGLLQYLGVLTVYGYASDVRWL